MTEISYHIHRIPNKTDQKQWTMFDDVISENTDVNSLEYVVDHSKALWILCKYHMTVFGWSKATAVFMHV